MVYFVGGTKQPKMIFDGSEYVCEKRRATKTTWKCTKYFKFRCRARAYTYGKTLKLTHEKHNHKPTVSGEKCKQLTPYTVSVMRAT